jgi:hypothetical protein
MTPAGLQHSRTQWRHSTAWECRGERKLTAAVLDSRARQQAEHMRDPAWAVAVQAYSSNRTHTYADACICRQPLSNQVQQCCGCRSRCGNMACRQLGK